MNELSYNILDIANNSLKADASLLCLSVDVDTKLDLLTVIIADDGCGMTPQQLKNCVDPFSTSRTTRKVGMGIPLYKMLAEQCEGKFCITSEKGVGTTTKAVFKISHIDRPPLGDIADTVGVLLSTCDKTDIVFEYSVDGDSFNLDSRQLKEVLGDDICDTHTIVYLKEMVKENILNINGGKNI